MNFVEESVALAAKLGKVCGGKDSKVAVMAATILLDSVLDETAPFPEVQKQLKEMQNWLVAAEAFHRTKKVTLP